MNSEIKVYSYPNGEIQRVQVVRWDDWAQVDFLHLDYNEAAVDCFSDIYQNYLVPACPWIFGNMIMFHIPESVAFDFPMETEKYGVVGDRLTAASIALQKGVKIVHGKPVFKDSRVEEFWRFLEKENCVRIIRGKLPMTKVIPVGKFTGYLSEKEPEAAMKVNASFFIMDPIDCATIYDQVGTTLGLCVKDGVIQNPPLFSREALLVKKDGSITIDEVDIRNLEIEISGKRYSHGKNAVIYSRPESARTPNDKRTKIVIIGNRVAAIKDHGSVPIPASGFVLSVDEAVKVLPQTAVVYHGMEDVAFGIQVGNSIIRSGVKTQQFISRFYNIYHLEKIPFPPSLYPMDFQKARAARIALGADKNGKPMLFWAEGKGKLSYTVGEDSTGASLREMANIAADLGMVHAVNLDGGGSAQILLRNERVLRISDRNKSDNSDAERLVPLGLIVR